MDCTSQLEDRLPQIRGSSFVYARLFINTGEFSLLLSVRTRLVLLSSTSPVRTVYGPLVKPSLKL
ncbi:hypothetical protein Mapa_002868 [Marchantia paleacea]|nr:hypothetical protein Mapa_002868 [Marchantia paleacea]